MKLSENLPQIGHHAPLSDYLEYLKQYTPCPDIIQDVFTRLTEIASRSGLCAIVVQEVYPESMVDPSSKINPWFIRLKKAVVYSYDTSRIEGTVEYHLTHFTFALE